MIAHGLTQRRPQHRQFALCAAGAGARHVARGRRAAPALGSARHVATRRRSARRIIRRCSPSTANRSGRGPRPLARTASCSIGCARSVGGTSACCGTFGWVSTASGLPSRSQASTARRKGCCGCESTLAATEGAGGAGHASRADPADPRPRTSGCGWSRGRPTCSPLAPPDSPQSRSRARTRGAPNGPASSQGRRVTVVMDADCPGRQAALEDRRRPRAPRRGARADC